MNYHSFKKNWQPLTNTRRTSVGEEGAEQIATFLANRPTVSENERKTHAPRCPCVRKQNTPQHRNDMFRMNERCIDCSV